MTKLGRLLGAIALVAAIFGGTGCGNAEVKNCCCKKCDCKDCQCTRVQVICPN